MPALRGLSGYRRGINSIRKHVLFYHMKSAWHSTKSVIFTRLIIQIWKWLFTFPISSLFRVIKTLKTRQEHTVCAVSCIFSVHWPFLPWSILGLNFNAALQMGYIQTLYDLLSTFKPAPVDCPNTLSSLRLRDKPLDNASSGRAARCLLSGGEHVYYFWVSLHPVQHVKLSGPDK